MKCSASPIICTAAEAQPASEARAARDVLDALLFREVLKPLAQSMGPAGDVLLGGVVDDLFVRRAR
jgi:hypothetical protein